MRQFPNWSRDSWVTQLNAFSSGETLNVYSSLSDEDALDYECLKKALLRR